MTPCTRFEIGRRSPRLLECSDARVQHFLELVAFGSRREELPPERLVRPCWPGVQGSHLSVFVKQPTVARSCPTM